MEIILFHILGAILLTAATVVISQLAIYLFAILTGDHELRAFVEHPLKGNF